MTRRLAWPVAVAVAAWFVWRWSSVPEPAVEALPPAPLVVPSEPANAAPDEPVVSIEPLATSDAQRQPLVAQPEERKSKRDATLWVEVVSRETGAPVADVWITISGPELSATGSGVSALDGGPGAFPSTGADGRARFRVPPGAYELELRWDQFRSRVEVKVPELAAGEERTQRIEIPTSADQRFLGRVLDERTDAPIPGAEVLLFHGDSAGSSWYVYQRSNVMAELARTTTDAEGRFELATRSSQRFEMVRVRAQGFATGYTCVQPGHDERGTEVVLRVGPSATLVARVEQARQPAAKIWVRLSLGERGICSAETGSDGRCSFEDVPAGVEITTQLTRPMPDAALTSEALFPWERLYQEIAEPVVLVPGERKEVLLELGVLCTVSGVVRDPEGHPVPNVHLCLLRNSAFGQGGVPEEPFEFELDFIYPDVFSTDDAGSFVIPDLPSATWWLGPVDRRYAAPAQRIEILEGMTHSAVQLVVLDRKAKLETPSSR